MKVSLIVPVYNVEKYIHDFMRSVVTQSFKDFEVILVDDCSTDKSGRICDEYAREYPFCRVFHHEANRGVGAARNTGLDHARGELIAFADPDDSLKPDFLEEMVRVRDHTGCDMVICNFEVNHVQDGKIVKTEVSFPDIRQERSDVLSVLCSLYPRLLLFYCWNKLLRRDIITKRHIRFGSFVVWEDHLFVFEYCKYIDRIEVINEPLYEYRRFMRGRVTSSTKQRSAKLSYEIVIALLDSGLELAASLEKRENDPEQAEMLRQYVREHFLQNTYHVVLGLSRTTLPLREQRTNIKYISKDYSERQRGHRIWKSGRRIDAIFHFLLMHRMNLMMLLAVNIRRRKKRREA